MSDESVAIETGATTRRAMFAGAGAAGAAAVLAACGTDDSDYDPYTGRPANAGAETSAPPSEAPSSEAPAEGEEQESEGLAQTGEVEVGGGVVLGDQDVVVTQPTAGEWKGFSATCTHEGCTVTDVTNGTINCNCHGSKFSIADGSVVNGPAAQPLEERTVAVEDDWVVLT
jgi:Rieske Fe-S protein